MKTIKYNKLVRDNIPDIITASGKECDYDILDDRDYVVKLKEKLIEEAREVVTAVDTDEIIRELADVLEIVDAIESHYSIDHSEVIKIKEQKGIKNGKYEKKIILFETREFD